MTVAISAHAAQRYRERVDPSVTEIEAISILRRSQRALDCAAAFGCSVVILGNGARAIIEDGHVVTVLGPHAGSRLRLRERRQFA